MTKTYVLISYDISNDNVRTRLAKRLKDYGRRAQFSVFEAEITADEMSKLKRQLAQVKLQERDSIRLYALCRNCTGNVTIWGHGELAEDPDYLIV